MKGDDITMRMFRFSVEILSVVRRLSNDRVASHVAKQLIRSATSGGANYEEARSAESRADFVHKLHVAAKEVQADRGDGFAPLQRRATHPAGQRDRSDLGGVCENCATAALNASGFRFPVSRLSFRFGACGNAVGYSLPVFRPRRPPPSA